MKIVKANYLNIVVILVLFTTLVSSCSIHLEKRRYRSGYHVEVMKPGKQAPLGHHRNVSETEVMKNKLEFGALVKDSGKITLPHQEVKKTNSNIQKLNLITNKPLYPKRLKRDEKCDVIVLINGEKMEVLVIEVGEKEIRYKNCDDTKGSIHIIKSEMIDNIIFRNGDIYIPENKIQVDFEKEKRKAKTTFVLSIIALSVAGMSLLFSFFIYPLSVISFAFSVMNLIFSFIVALVSIRPHRFARSLKTKLSIIFSIVAFIVTILAMIIVFL